MKIKDINVSELTSFSKERLNTIRREVLFDNELVEIPSILLPDVFESSYYFVSYSHKDFRDVYSDIITLEEGGLNVWYDRGIPAGKNWKDIANDYMFPSECRGVIFYLSESSILSDAVIDEIRYAKKLNKRVIVIMLPFTHEYIHNGEITKGKYYSAFQMGKILQENHLDISDDKLNELSSLIPDEELYLPYNMTSSMKIEKIVKSAPDIPPFECVEVESDFISYKKKGLIVTKLNNYKISKIDDTILPLNNETIGRIRFATGVCANAQLLESIEIPSSYGVDIGNFSFYGCMSLSNINIGKFYHGVIGEYAFCGCPSLKEVYLHDVALIKSKAFLRCANLKRVTLEGNVKIINEAFQNNRNLEYVDLGHAIEVRDSAFADCPKLKEVKYSSRARYGQAVFENNEGIETIDLNLKQGIGSGSVDEWTFAYMHGLKDARLVLGDWYNQDKVLGDLFFECENLERVDITFHENTSKTVIENYAFSGCFKLKEVKLSAKPIKICSKSFFECKELDTLFSEEKGTLDLSGVEELEDRVFVSTKFEKILIGYQLTKIGYSAFQDMKELKEIHINNNVINQDIISSALGKIEETKTIEIYFRGTKEEFVSEDKPQGYNYILKVHCGDGDIEISI